MKKLRTKNLIAFILAVILMLSFVPNITVVADDKEDIEKGKYDSSEYYAYECVNSNGWDAMGEDKRKEKIEAYKSDIPDIAKAGEKTVQEYLALKATERVELIKKWRKDNPKSNTACVTVEDLQNKVTPISLKQAKNQCTKTSTTMVIQNCFCIDSKYQLANKVDGADYDYGSSDYSGDYVTSGVTAYVTTHGDESFGGADSYGANGALSGYGDGTCYIGDDKKLFVEMNSSEIATVIKKMWANGYFMVMGVRYKRLSTGSLGEYNVEGAKGYWASENKCNDSTYFIPHEEYGYDPNCASGTWNGKDYYISSNHLVMVSGVADDNKVYLRDPAWGWHTLDFESSYNGVAMTFQPAYIVAWKSSKNSPKKLSGGKSAPLTDDEIKEIGDGSGGDGGDDGDGTKTVQIGAQTFYSEVDLSSWRKLDEANIHDVFLEGATIDNLGASDVYSLNQWKQQREQMMEESSLTKVTRVSLMVLGIVLSVYFILLYIAYWLDRINNFIEVRFLELLTFRKLTLSDTEDDCTYEAKGLEGKLKTVNHKAIIKICILGEFMAVLLITGVVYKFVLWIVGLVESIKIKLTS